MSITPEEDKIYNHGKGMISLRIWNNEMDLDWFRGYQKNHADALPALTRDPNYICVCDWCLKNSLRARTEMVMRIQVETTAQSLINRVNAETKRKEQDDD